MAFFILGGVLILMTTCMGIAACVISIKQGFEESKTWGILNLLGALGCLASIPNIIFCFTDFKERSAPIWLWLGTIIPIIVAFFFFYLGSVLTQTG